MLCQREEREAGRSYPRTCPTCKLGPCQKFGPRPLQSLAEAQAEIDRLTAALDAANMQIEVAADDIQTLRNERDTALAQLAAAFEVAAEEVENWNLFDIHLDPMECAVARRVRVIIPSHASAALSRMLDAADAAGQERMREAAAKWLIDAGIAGDESDDPLAVCIRDLPITPRPDREGRDE